MNESETLKHRESLEKILISIMLKNNDIFIQQMLRGLKPDQFSNFEHIAIYATMIELDDANEQVTLSKLAMKLPSFVKTIEILARIEIAEYGANDIDKYVTELKSINDQMYLAGKVLNLYDDLMKRQPYDLDHDQLKQITNFYNSLDQGQSDDINTKPITSHLEIALQDLENNHSSRGITTGFPSLDHYIGGLQPGHLVILGARPSVGKTAIAFNMLNNMPKEHKSLVFSLEMDATELVYRQLANFGNIDSMNFSRGLLTENEMDRTIAAANEIMKQNILINDDSALKLEDIVKEIRWQYHKRKIEIVIIDHHDLLFSRKKLDRRMEVGYCAVTLKNLAKELQIPIILLAQLRRPTEAYINKRPNKYELKESSALEQTANVVLLLHRESGAIEEKDRRLEEDEAEIIIDKCRNGICGVFKIKHNLKYNRFYEGNYNNEHTK